MTKLKIEKQDPCPGFELLYEKSVKKINETNIPTTVLSDELKNKFLNFYNLPSNEQLELISDLLKVTGLPQEMTDALNQFPYFHTIPSDIFIEIGSFLTKKEPKEDKNISSLIRTHKRLHALFQPDRIGDLSAQLLLNVATGKQYKAEKIVDMHPELQLVRGTITDYSSRTFKDITAYEYAYWAKDTHMRRMLEKYMDAETKVEMLKCCENIEKNGLTYVQHGEVKCSKYFDFTPLKTALKNFLDEHENRYRTQNWTAMKTAWMQAGIAQRDIPAHVVNEYCRKDRSFCHEPIFNEGTLPRELTFYNIVTNKNEPWFPLVISDSAGLGVNFTIVRGSSYSQTFARATFTDVMSWWHQVLIWSRDDLSAINQLDKERTDDLTHSRENLMGSVENRKLRL